MAPADPGSTPKKSTKGEKILKSREEERKSPNTARASRGQELKWEIPVKVPIGVFFKLTYAL
jgi:hypothetical protein